VATVPARLTAGLFGLGAEKIASPPSPACYSKRLAATIPRLRGKADIPSRPRSDNEETTKRVRGVYREWKTQHIDDQLDDVFRYAFGGGVSVTAEPGQSMTWTIDPSEAACADCEDNSLAGAIPAGEPFPTGHASAPAHPGCRCLTLPAHQ